MKKWKVWLALFVWLAIGVTVNVINKIGTEYEGGEGSAPEEVEEKY